MLLCIEACLWVEYGLMLVVTEDLLFLEVDTWDVTQSLWCDLWSLCHLTHAKAVSVSSQTASVPCCVDHGGLLHGSVSEGVQTFSLSSITSCDGCEMLQQTFDLHTSENVSGSLQCWRKYKHSEEQETFGSSDTLLALDKFNK